MNENELGWLLCFLIASVGIVIAIILYRYINYKRKAKVTPVQQQEAVIPSVGQPITATIEPPKPKPTKRKVIMSVTVINNKTDKEYVIESENDFGITWSYMDDKSKPQNFSLLRINQLHSENIEKWTGVSRFTDFSVKSTVWKEFDIIYEEENNNKTTDAKNN